MGKSRKLILRSAPVRAALYAILCVVVLLAANWIRLLNVVGLDNLLERQFLAYASHTVGRSIGESIRLIYIREKDNGALKNFSEDTERQCWRQHHGELLRKLKEAGARVVAFDLVFPPAVAECEGQNEAFVTALHDVRQDGKMRVIIGYDPAADIDPAIGREVKISDMALVRVGRQQQGEPGTQFLTSVLLAEANETAGAPGAALVYPIPITLAIFVAEKWTWPADIVPGILPGDRQVTFSRSLEGVEPFTVEIRSCVKATLNCPLSIDATRHWYALLPVWMGEGAGFAERSYASVVLQSRLGEDYANKIVVIGARTPEEVVALEPKSIAGTVWGYQVHARALADLLSGSYLRRPPVWVVFVFLMGLVALGIVAQLWLPKLEMRIPLPWLGNYPIPLGLVLVGALHGFLMIELLRYGYWLHDIGYQWLALAAGFYFASRPLQPKSG